MESVFGRYFKGDKIIWMIVIFLSIISLLAIYSSTGSLAYKFQGGNTAYYFIKQFVFLAVGLSVVFITHMINCNVYSPLSKVLLLISIPLLLVTLVFGASLNQAARWLEVPGLGVTIQTSDIAKMALVMYVARILSQRQKEIKDFKLAFVPIVVPVAVICLLILPANFSTAVLLGVTCWLLMLIGRISLKHLFGLTGIGVVLLAIFIFIALQFNTVNRVQTWKHRIENFASGDGDGNFQVNQSKIAIATGGIIGKGPGNSTQRNFLPHPYSDFIFAIIVEEYGLIGGAVILLLYLILLFRAGVIVKKANRTFPAFLAIGLALLLVLQAMVNMMVAVNLIPVTGQPLPLVSMGGTSLFFTSAAFGIIISISRTQGKSELFDGEEEVKNNS
ncbi:MAG: FtsW/RodA/SpoVE family cell cycle protein [Tenuifilaceae bacterium]